MRMRSHPFRQLGFAAQDLLSGVGVFVIVVACIQAYYYFNFDSNRTYWDNASEDQLRNFTQGLERQVSDAPPRSDAGPMPDSRPVSDVSRLELRRYCYLLPVLAMPGPIRNPPHANMSAPLLRQMGEARQTCQMLEDNVGLHGALTYGQLAQLAKQQRQRFDLAVQQVHPNRTP